MPRLTGTAKPTKVMKPKKFIKRSKPAADRFSYIIPGIPSIWTDGGCQSNYNLSNY